MDHHLDIGREYGLIDYLIDIGLDPVSSICTAPDSRVCHLVHCPHFNDVPLCVAAQRLAAPQEFTEFGLRQVLELLGVLSSKILNCLEYRKINLIAASSCSCVKVSRSDARSRRGPAGIHQARQDQVRRRTAGARATYSTSVRISTDVWCVSSATSCSSTTCGTGTTTI